MGNATAPLPDSSQSFPTVFKRKFAAFLRPVRDLFRGPKRDPGALAAVGAGHGALSSDVPEVPAVPETQSHEDDSESPPKRRRQAEHTTEPAISADVPAHSFKLSGAAVQPPAVPMLDPDNPQVRSGCAVCVCQIAFSAHACVHACAHVCHAIVK